MCYRRSRFRSMTRTPDETRGPLDGAKPIVWAALYAMLRIEYRNPRKRDLLDELRAIESSVARTLTIFDVELFNQKPNDVPGPPVPRRVLKRPRSRARRKQSTPRPRPPRARHRHMFRESSCDTSGSIQALRERSTGLTSCDGHRNA